MFSLSTIIEAKAVKGLKPFVGGVVVCGSAGMNQATDNAAIDPRHPRSPAS